MAQAKTSSSTKSGSTKRSRASSKPRPRSRGSTGKERRSQATNPRKPNPKSRKAPAGNGAGRVEAARHAVEATAKDAGHTVGSAASKAKVPLLAGGAALAGAAGGIVLGARRARRHGGVARAIPRRPQVKVNSHDLARAAKEVGSFGAQVGHLANELQQAREANGSGQRRSPLEVVLEGLTARRSQ